MWCFSFPVSILLGSGREPTFNKTLPVGNERRNYSAFVEVRVKNYDGEINSQDIPVKVSDIGQHMVWWYTVHIICETLMDTQAHTHARTHVREYI